MKLLKIGLLFLVGAVSGGDRGVRFAEEPGELKETAGDGKREGQGPRSILKKEGAPKKEQKSIGVDEGSLIKTFPPRDVEKKQPVSPLIDSGDEDRALTKKEETAIKDVADGIRLHEGEERSPEDDVASQARLDEKIARVKIILEQILKETPDDKDRIRQANEYLDALTNAADFLRFLETSEKFRDIKFSQSKLEDLFVAFDFPVLTDEAVRQMDRNELWEVETIEKGTEKNLKDAQLSGEQAFAIKAYFKNRSEAVKKLFEVSNAHEQGNEDSVLQGIQEEADARMIQRIDQTALDIEKVKREKDPQRALMLVKNLEARLRQKFADLSDEVTERMDDQISKLQDLTSALHAIDSFLTEKEITDQKMEEALSYSLQFSPEITERVLKKMLEQGKTVQNSTERERIIKQVDAVRNLFELKDTISSANADKSKFFSLLREGKSDPSLSKIVDLSEKVSSLQELFQNEELRVQLEGYKTMSPELTKAAHLEAFLFKKDSLVSNTIDPETLATIMVSALETSDVVTELVAQKIEKRASEVTGLPKETQTSLRQMAFHARSFVKLRQEVQQALQIGDVVALQKLQDQLRDLYEKVFQDSLHDQDAETLRVALQTMTNDLLRQIKEKVSTMQGLITPPLKGVALVKYKFQRFFTYARTALRGKRPLYASELKSNKTNGFGLQTVDFSTKARVQGYVDSAEKIVSAENSNPQAVETIHNEFSALAGIRDLKGVVSPKEAEKSLNWSAVHMTDELFIKKMTLNTGSERYRKLARMLLERTTVLGEEHDAAKKIAGKIFPLPDGRNWSAPDAGEEVFIKGLFAVWRAKFITSTSRETIENPNSNIDLVALQILAEFNGADPAFIRLLQTRETALYALRAFSYEKAVQMPLQEAQLAFKFAQNDATLKTMLKAWNLVGSEKSKTAKESTAQVGTQGVVGAA